MYSFGLVVLPSLLAAANPSGETALDRYVAKPDADYAWRVVERRPSALGVWYLLHMASQTWRSGKDVDRILWTHWLEIYVPHRVEHSAGLLFISGGQNDHTRPQGPRGRLVRMAVETRSVVALLQDVPNQPLYFLADPEFRARQEDAILAFAWSRFAATHDPTWLALLPMVKSAVRAMDTITAFCASLPHGGLSVGRFVVAGASKRGWTSWLTAAADRRVIGVAPVVIDMLNLRPSMKHHHAVYGGYSHALDDYVENGIVKMLDRPEATQALRIIDPYSYRQRLTMPKMIINSTGDQFFLPDSWKFYWKALPGPKHLRYIPNTNHSLNASAYDTLQSFYAAVFAGKDLPEFSWTVESPGRIRVRTETPPLRVQVWAAHNPKARDFRLETIGPAWKARSLAPSAPNEYLAEQPAPSQGWTAFLVALTFPDPNTPTPGATVTLTTGVSVIPDTAPKGR